MNNFELLNSETLDHYELLQEALPLITESDEDQEHIPIKGDLGLTNLFH